jgi:ethanolamine utilization protein EutA
LKITAKEEANKPADLVEIIKKKLDWFDLEEELQPVALALKGKSNFSFKEITELAKIIVSGMDTIISNKLPLIIILENDAAKVLGQTINRLLGQKEDVISLDGIKVNNGDYIDIGKPLAKGKVVPVIIKTLIFGK